MKEEVKKIILGFFTDRFGDGSSKRGIMWATYLLWSVEIFANLFWGFKLDISLSVQLFSFLTTTIVLVFGEQIADWIEKRSKKNDEPK